MPVYVYKAIDAQGREITDTMTASGTSAVVSSLAQKQLYAVNVEEKKDSAAGGMLLSARHVTRNDIDSFIRELSNLLTSGVALSRALNLLAREASKPQARRQWQAIGDSVSGGMSLADSLAQFPASFSDVHVAMVRAGETGGFLDVVLRQIADFRERERDLIGKVKTALIYPVILSVLGGGILVFLLIWFIPRFSTMFDEFGGSLPPLTMTIVAASEFVIKYWILIVAAIVGLVIITKRAVSSSAGKKTIERMILRMPVIGKATAHFALVRFCRMLGTLVSSGVPLVRALRVANDAIGNQTLSETVTGAIDRVSAGVSLAKSLADCRQLFPSSVIEMITIAEESGRIDDELVRLAKTFEEDLDRQLKVIVALAEPALLFVMAALVGTVVIGMLLPIFNLQELIK